MAGGLVHNSAGIIIASGGDCASYAAGGNGERIK